MNLLINGSFEEPVPPGGSAVYPAASVPGWNAPSIIEIWKSGGVGGVIAYQGNQLTELDGAIANIWQDVVIPPWAVGFRWGFAHRGRPGVGTERTRLRIGPTTSTPTTVPIVFDTPDATNAWISYSGVWTIPPGMTPSVRFVLQALAAGGSVGNLVDAAFFEPFAEDTTQPGCCGSSALRCYGNPPRPAYSVGSSPRRWYDISTGVELPANTILFVCEVTP